MLVVPCIEGNNFADIMQKCHGILFPIACIAIGQKLTLAHLAELVVTDLAICRGEHDHTALTLFIYHALLCSYSFSYIYFGHTVLTPNISYLYVADFQLVLFVYTLV